MAKKNHLSGLQVLEIMDFIMAGKRADEISEAMDIKEHMVSGIFNPSYTNVTGLDESMTLSQFRKVNNIVVARKPRKPKYAPFVTSGKKLTKEDIEKILFLAADGKDLHYIAVELQQNLVVINKIFNGETHTRTTKFVEGYSLEQFQIDYCSSLDHTTIDEDTTCNTHFDLSLQLDLKPLQRRLNDIKREEAVLDEQELEVMDELERIQTRREALKTFRDDIFSYLK